MSLIEDLKAFRQGPKFLALICVVIALLFGSLLIYFPESFFNALAVTINVPETASANEPVPVSVFVQNRSTGKGVANAVVSFQFLDDRGVAEKKTVKTNREGFCSLVIQPARLKDLLALRYVVTVAAGRKKVHFAHHIRRRDEDDENAARSHTFIITDKAIYQPGQSIHYSAFLVSPQSHLPQPSEPTNIKIFDPNGNILQNRETRSSKYGNVHGSLKLAGDILPGAYKILVTHGQKQQQKSVTVKRYVPKRIRAKLSFTPRYLAVDRSVSLEIKLKYFSGQPVSQAKLTFTLENPKTQKRQEYRLNADNAGKARLVLDNLNKFLPQRAAWAEVSARLDIRDGGSPESWKRQLTIYRKDRIVEILLPGGTAFPGTENRMLLCAYHPDGSPAPGEYKLHLGKRKEVITVGNKGYAEFSVYMPGKDIDAEVSWKGRNGRRYSATIPFKGLQHNLFRCRLPFAPLQRGQAVSCEVELHPGIAGRIKLLELFVVSGNKTHFTRVVKSKDFRNGIARTSFDIPRNFSGRLVLYALGQMDDGQACTSRIALPVLASLPELKVLTAKSKLLPGEENKVKLKLTDGGGRPVAGAATLLITDAGIAARAGAQYPEEELQAWLVEQSPKLHLPPPVLAALIRHNHLSFLPLPQQLNGRAQLTNRSRIARQDRARARRWRNLILASCLALTVAFLIVQLVLFLSRRKVLIKVCVVIALLLILAGMCLPVLSKAREKARRTDSPRIPESEDLRSRPGSRQPSARVPLTTRVREYFPETLLFLPEVELDKSGQAVLPVTLADNITTWHVSAIALADSGGLAGGATEFLAGKPFFVATDFPVAFIRNDEPVIRLRAFNNAQDGDARIVLEKADFFKAEIYSQTVHMKANSSHLFELPLRLTKSGHHKLTIRATLGPHRDTLVRLVQITENGKEVVRSASGGLAASRGVTHSLSLPENTIRQNWSLRIQASPLAEMISGIEGLLRQPYGCFEQTTSVNYPNLMILDYLKARDKLNPELEERARGYLRSGYQRLLQYEVRGGGFSLYGRQPASLWLSALGLMQFQDMSRFITVDPAIIERTWNYIAANFSKADSRSQSYAVWAVLKAGKRDREIFRHLRNLGRIVNNRSESMYHRLLALNAGIEHYPRSRNYREQAKALATKLLQKKGQTNYRTLSSAYAYGARTECLALAAIALSRANTAPLLQERLVKEIIQHRKASGCWPGTQATVLALQALNVAWGRAVSGEVRVHCGDKLCGSIILDAGHDKPVFLELSPPGRDPVSIRFRGRGKVSYVLLAKGYRRWGTEEQQTARAGLNLRVELPARVYKIDEQIPVTVILSERGKGAENCMVEIGLGSALRADERSLSSLVKSAKIEKYEISRQKLILYLRDLPPGPPKELRLHVIAIRPGTFQLPPSRTYEYYNPENIHTIPGKKLTVISTR